jgi:hypothetical protein
MQARPPLFVPQGTISYQFDFQMFALLGPTILPVDHGAKDAK